MTRPEREKIIKAHREKNKREKIKATQLNFSGQPADQHLTEEQRKKLSKGIFIKVE